MTGEQWWLSAIGAGVLLAVLVVALTVLVTDWWLRKYGEDED